MATYEITSPDGHTYEVTAPDNASESAVLAYAKTQFEKQAAPSLSPEQIAEQKQRAMKSMVRAERSPIGNVVGDIAAGATTLGGKLLDLPSQMFNAPWLRSEMGQSQDVADKGSVSYLAGGLLDPLAQAAGSGAFAAASRSPAIPKLTEAASTYAKNVLAGGATGVGLSAAHGGDSVEGGLFGAGIAAALGNPTLGKAVGRLSDSAKNLGNSLYAIISKGGRASTAQKMVLDNIPMSERETILKVLQAKGIDVSDLGSDLTASQAVAKSRIGQSLKDPAGARMAALEADIAKMPGGEQLNVMAAQRAANQTDIMNTLSGGRGAAVDPLLGMSADDIAAAAARTQRGATAKKLYPTGEVTGDPRLNEILGRPGVEQALGIEAKSAGNVPRVTQVGKDIPAKTVHQSVFTEWQQTPYKEELPEVFAKYPIKSLQNQYRLMDKEATRLMKTGASTDETRAYELLQAKNDLGKWLSEASPEWAQANKMFAFQSQPVRKMEVGAALKDKLEQSPAAFLKATEDIKDQSQMIKMATGRPNQTLTDVFNLGQMSKISGLRNESQITKEVEKLQGLAKASLGDERAFQLPNLLNVWVAVANKVARESAKATVDDVTTAAADILANPAKLRALLNEDKMRRAMFAKPISAAAMAPAVSGMSNVRGMLQPEEQ